MTARELGLKLQPAYIVDCPFPPRPELPVEYRINSAILEAKSQPPVKLVTTDPCPRF
jgi:hypothetical protein